MIKMGLYCSILEPNNHLSRNVPIKVRNKPFFDIGMSVATLLGLLKSLRGLIRLIDYIPDYLNLQTILVTFCKFYDNFWTQESIWLENTVEMSPPP